MSPEEMQRTVESVLDQIKARDMIRKHLQYSNHRDTPVSSHVWVAHADNETLVFVRFDAVVSSDHRTRGAFRWPEDDSWVIPTSGSFALGESHFTGWNGKLVQLVYSNVHHCGVEMQKQIPQEVSW